MGRLCPARGQGWLSLVTTPFQVPRPTWPEQTLSKHWMNGRFVCSLTSWLLAALQAVTVGGEAGGFRLCNRMEPPQASPAVPGRECALSFSDV